MSKREALNLSVDKELKRQMKIYCAANREDVSDVTEMLYVEFLKSHGIEVVAEETPPTQEK